MGRCNAKLSLRLALARRLGYLGVQGPSKCGEAYLTAEAVPAGRVQQPGVRPRAGQGQGPERWSAGGGGSREPRGSGKYPGAHSSRRAKQHQQPSHGAPRASVAPVLPTREPDPTPCGGRGRGCEPAPPGPAPPAPGPPPERSIARWAGLHGRSAGFGLHPSALPLSETAYPWVGGTIRSRVLSSLPLGPASLGKPRLLERSGRGWGTGQVLLSGSPELWPVLCGMHICRAFQDF